MLYMEIKIPILCANNKGYIPMIIRDFNLHWLH